MKEREYFRVLGIVCLIGAVWLRTFWGAVLAVLLIGLGMGGRSGKRSSKYRS